MSIEFRRLWNSLVAVKKIERARQARRLNDLYRFLRREMKGLRTSDGSYIGFKKVDPNTICVYEYPSKWMNCGIGIWLQDIKVYEEGYCIGGSVALSKEEVLLCLIVLAH